MLTFDLVGRRCLGVRRIRYRVRGECDRTAGPVEFCWFDGTYPAIDAWTDWVLTISPSRPGDPQRLRATYRRTGGVRRMVAAQDLAIGQLFYRSPASKSGLSAVLNVASASSFTGGGAGAIAQLPTAMSSLVIEVSRGLFRREGPRHWPAS